MSEHTENKVVETAVNSVVESTTKSNKALYVVGAGLLAFVTYFGAKKCYEYMKKKSDE